MCARPRNWAALRVTATSVVVLHRYGLRWDLYAAGLIFVVVSIPNSKIFSNKLQMRRGYCKRDAGASEKKENVKCERGRALVQRSKMRLRQWVFQNVQQKNSEYLHEAEKLASTAAGGQSELGLHAVSWCNGRSTPQGRFAGVRGGVWRVVNARNWEPEAEYGECHGYRKNWDFLFVSNWTEVVWSECSFLGLVINEATWAGGGAEKMARVFAVPSAEHFGVRPA